MDFDREKLTELREARCQSQREFAEAYAIPQSSLSRWETGESVPHPKTIRELADKLGVDFKVFIKKAKKAVKHG